MGVDVTGGPLSFVAEIDENNFELSLKKMSTSIDALVLKADSIKTVMQNMTDPVSLVEYTTKLKEVEAEIAKLGPKAKGSFGAIAFEVTDTTTAVDGLNQSLSKPVENPVKSLGPSLEELKARMEAVIETQIKIEDQFEQGAISAEVYAEKLAQLSAIESDLDRLTAIRVAETNTEVVASKKVSAAIVEEIGILETLKSTIKALNADRLKIVDEAELAKINARLQTAELELAHYNNIGKVGVTELAKAIEKPIGQYGRLQYAAKLYEAQARTSMNPDIIAKYNAKLEQANIRLAQLKNVGRAGFDEMGNAIEQNVQKQSKFAAALSRITNLGNLGATVISRLSRQVIGLGVGMLSFAVGAKAIEMLITAIQGMVAYSNRLDIFAKNIANINAVNAEAAKNAGEQSASLKILYDATQDVTLSIKDRTDAARELKKEYPDAFANSSLNSILNGKEADSYRELTRAIIDQAKAEAAINKIKELSGKLIELDIERDKINIKKYNEMQNARKKGVDYGAGESNNTTASDISVEDQIKYSKQRADFAQSEVLAQKKAVEAQIDLVTNAFGGVKKLANVLDKNNKLIQEPLKNFDTIIKNASDKDDLENLKKSLQAKMEALDFNNPELEKYKDKIKEVEEAEKKYDTIKSKKPKADTSQQAAFNLAKAITKQINENEKLKAEFASKDKTRDEQEADAIAARFKAEANRIDALNLNYDKYFKKFGQKGVDKHNADPANKDNQLRRIDKDEILALEPIAQEQLKARQTVEITKNQVEDQKQIFNEYEKYKLQFGKEAADQMFAGEIKGYSSFIAYLKSLVPKGDDDKAPGAGALKDYLKKQIESAELSQDKQYSDQVYSNLTRIIDATRSAASQKLRIEEQYQKDVLTLVLNYAGKDLDEKLRLLKLNKDKSIDQTRAMAFEESQVGIDAAESLFNMTRAKLKAHIAQLKAELKSGTYTDKDGNAVKLSPAQQKYLQEVIKGAQDLESSSKPAVKSFQKMADYASAAAQGFGELANSLQEINPELADSVASAGELAGILSSVASTATSVMTGNIAGIITGVFSIASGVINYFNRGRESAIKSAAEIKKYQDDLIKNEIAYNELLRDRARSQDDINKLTITELKAREQMLALQKQQALADYNRLLNQIQATGQQITGEHTEKYGGFLGIGRKTKVVKELAGLNGVDYDALEKLYTEGKLTDDTKSWFEELKKVHDELDTIGVSIEDAATALKAAVTGTTADSIAQSIIDGFKAGKRTATDFADDFKTMMQNALISSFQSDFLKAKIEAFYEQFADASADGGLTAAKIAELKDEYAKIIADAASKLDDIQKITGIGVSDINGTNNISTAIKGITSTQADLLAGQFGGLRLSGTQAVALLGNTNMHLQTLINLSMNKLDSLVKIEVNTRTTALNSQYFSLMPDIKAALLSIDKKTGAASASLAANGKSG